MQDKVLRITVHVFQKSNGSPENFDPYDNNGNPTSDYYWIRDMIYLGSTWMSNLNPLMSNNGSPYIQDTKIRYDCVQVCEWKDDNLWDNNYHGDYYQCQEMYDYIITKPNVLYKNNSIHILIPGKPYQNPPKTVLESQGGRASGFGDKNWSMMNNVYSYYLSDVNSKSTGLLLHELGHNLGRGHTFPNDDCGDTPADQESCWCATSCGNNIMGYNCRKSAFSRCQVLDMHYCILNLNGWSTANIKDCLRDPLNLTTPVISGSNCISGVAPVTYNLSNYNFGTNVTWSVTPTNLFISSNGCGNNFTLTPISATTSTATITVNVDYGSFGFRSSTKVINLIASNQINGTYTYTGTSQNFALQASPQPNIIYGSRMYLDLTSPANAIFTWSKVSGPNTLITWNSGRSAYMDLTSGTSTTYSSTTSTTCGSLSKNFTFYRPTSALFTISPNPAINQISILAERSKTEWYNDDKNNILPIVIDPFIDQVNLYDEVGNKVILQKLKAKSKSLSLDISKLKVGNYIAEIVNDNLLFQNKVIIIK